MKLTDTISEKMSDVFKPQRKFATILLTSIILMRGKVNFGNSSRHSEPSEKTCSRQFRIPFDFAESDNIGITMTVDSHTSVIAATDCGFITESGKHTCGLADFYDGSRSEAEKGLEISLLAVADVVCNTAHTVSAWRTPDTLASGHTRTDWYPEHFVQDAQCLPPSVRHLATDGYYAKKKFTDGVCAGGWHRISKLRHDADLRHLYTGKQKARGRHGMYDGKIRFEDLSRFGFVGETDDGTSLYTIVADSPSLKRNVGVVHPVRRRNDRIETALLFSTDTGLPATDIHRFHKSRFQIGFLFRDAKQFVGLSDCQSRCEISLDFRFNACMSALNVMKWESRKISQSETSQGCSIASI
jgi:Transposase DDE domain